MPTKPKPRACSVQRSPDPLGAQGLTALAPEARAIRYKRGELARTDLSIWAARFPDEVPLVNGEFAWIASRLADLD